MTLATLAFIAPAQAAPSTPGGAISVAQVAEMLDQASSNRTAQQVLTAYLGGIGETAGVLVGLGSAACRRPLSLSAEEARHAIAAASAAGQARTLAATPLIVRDMLARAGCRRG
ncbi:MAG TPA: chlorophyllide reductase [Kaistia sp.]|nr:chlorophyllide reductase [Kaistia sp.]